MGFFEAYLMGVIISRIREDVWQVRNAYTRRLIGFVHVTFQSFLGCAICFSQSSKVTLLVYGALPLYALANCLKQ
jgi:ABC-type multidrug transport system fused ATPase/permease subunit